MGQFTFAKGLARWIAALCYPMRIVPHGIVVNPVRYVTLGFMDQIMTCVVIISIFRDPPMGIYSRSPRLS